MEKIYYPNPAKDGVHKYYIITKSGKKVHLVNILLLILPYIRMKQGDKDIF